MISDSAFAFTPAAIISEAHVRRASWNVIGASNSTGRPSAAFVRRVSRAPTRRACHAGTVSGSNVSTGVLPNTNVSPVRSARTVRRQSTASRSRIGTRQFAAALFLLLALDVVRPRRT